MTTLKEIVFFMFSHKILQVIINAQCFHMLVALSYNAESLDHTSNILSLNADRR